MKLFRVQQFDESLINFRPFDLVSNIDFSWTKHELITNFMAAGPFSQKLARPSVLAASGLPFFFYLHRPKGEKGI